MKKTFLFCVLFFTPCVNASDWTDADTWRESTWQVINIIDWGQTLDITNQCQDQTGRYKYETNPLLSKCPTRSEVNRYFITSAITHGLISNYLPTKYREAFQYVTIGFSAQMVIDNYRIGLKINF